MQLHINKCAASLLSGIALAGLGCFSGAASAADTAKTASATTDARSFAGMWRRVTVPRDPSDFIISTDLPYKPETQNIAATHRELFKQGRAAASAHLTCRPTGVQGVTTPKEAVLFMQTDKKLAMFSQEDREVRHVYIDAVHPKKVRPSYSGHSVGHWEGNVLVIDTIGYNGKGQLDEMGNPHSDQLHVVERWSKSEDGNLLNATFTITDPVNYTQAFTAKRQYRRTPGMRLLDYDCAENPRSDDFSNLTFEQDWFKPTCVRPVEAGIAAEKVVCTPRSTAGRK